MPTSLLLTIEFSHVVGGVSDSFEKSPFRVKTINLPLLAPKIPDAVSCSRIV